MHFNKIRKKIITIFAIIATILAVLALWYYQKNSFSKESLKLELLGPEQVNLTDEVDYVVKYKNNGNILLENVRLVFEYPNNAISTEDEVAGVNSAGSDESRREKKLSDIYPGEERSFSFRARLIGKENEAIVAKAWLSYQPKGLKSRYESATTLTTVMKNVPVTFEFDLPSRLKPGNEFRFRLNYFSNVDYPLSDLRIKVDYPNGFDYTQSVPVGLENNEWAISVLNRAEGGRVEVAGRLQGAISEEKSFRATLGVWHNGKFVALKETTKAVVMIEPMLYITQQINGNPGYIASPGDQLHYEISYKNIGDKPLTDLFLICRLDGKLFDYNSLKSELGKFQAGDNSVVFDWRNVPSLQFLNSQEEGRVEFWIDLKGESSFIEGRTLNPLVRNKVILSQTQNEFVTRVNSKIQIIQSGFFQDEIFGNTGSIPPKVGETTTYTITWRVKNSYNEVKNVRVKAQLPLSVRLTGQIFPTDQASKFAYDPLSREIVWEVGNLESWHGYINSATNISFQVALNATEDQRGQIVPVVGEAVITGEDSWTGQMLISRIGLINSGSVDGKVDDPLIGQIQ
ncbi:MAG: hypothetical protein V1905_02885 [bacterium]